MDRTIPWRSVLKTLRFTVEGPGSIPDGGTKIPHAEEKLSPHATTTKAQTAQLKSRCPAMQQNKLIYYKKKERDFE